MSQSTQQPPGTHPVLACAAELSAALKDVADDPLFMTAEQKAAALTELPGRARGRRRCRPARAV